MRLYRSMVCMWNRESSESSSRRPPQRPFGAGAAQTSSMGPLRLRPARQGVGFDAEARRCQEREQEVLPSLRAPRLRERFPTFSGRVYVSPSGYVMMLFGLGTQGGASSPSGTRLPWAELFSPFGASSSRDPRGEDLRGILSPRSSSRRPSGHSLPAIPVARTSAAPLRGKRRQDFFNRPLRVRILPGRVSDFARRCQERKEEGLFLRAPRLCERSPAVAGAARFLGVENG